MTGTVTWTGDESESGSVDYAMRTTCVYGTKKYAVYYTCDFFNQITKACIYPLTPYDDADYYSAFLEGEDVTIQNYSNNEIGQYDSYEVSIDYSDEDSFNDSFTEALEETIETLDQYNTKIGPEMMFGSSKVQSDDSQACKNCNQKRKLNSCGGKKGLQDIDNKQTVEGDADTFNMDYPGVDDTVSNIQSECYEAAINAMISECGFPEDEAKDYCFLDASFDKYNGEDYLVLELRAELDYDGLSKIIDVLDPIIAEYDSYAYFDPVDPGVATAWISLSAINDGEITSSTSVKSSSDLENEVDTFQVDLTNVKAEITDEYVTLNDGDLSFISDWTVTSLVEDGWNGGYDPEEVLEVISDAIFESIPEPGTYILSGYADLTFPISRSVYHNYSQSPDMDVLPEDNPEYGDIDVDYLNGQCVLKNFKADKI